MAQDHGDATLADLKRLLDQFAASRADRPRREAEAEYGDVLLYLIFLASKSGLDLLAGTNRLLDETVRDEQRLAVRH
jgi:hypothetical protein